MGRTKSVLCTLMDIIKPVKFPRHIAIIPDGTRRWARKQGLPDMEGARAGAENVHLTVSHLLDLGLENLTIWGFSSDNWKRTGDQIHFLFEQARAWIEKDGPWLNSRGVKLLRVGRTDRLPAGLHLATAACEKLTGHNKGMNLNIAFDYSGRAEIIEAIRNMMKEQIPPDTLDDGTVNRYLYTGGGPDIDLIIRTGGELRISNFMIWQAAYCEYYFTPVLWPDFGKTELDIALESYSQRHRRFGGD
jgi:undecaprenyl diphosphate synthase